jgi:hypothetical protein
MKRIGKVASLGAFYQAKVSLAPDDPNDQRLGERTRSHAVCAPGRKRLFGDALRISMMIGANFQWVLFPN